MKQQPRDRKNPDKRIQRSWAVEPAIGASGTGHLIAVRLHELEFFIPPKTATKIADALIDCVETGEPYEYYNSRRGKTIIINGETIERDQ